MTKTQRFLALLGTAMVLTYLATSLGLVTETNRVTIGLAFLIGPVAMVGITRLVRSLGMDDRPALVLAQAFLGSAFVLFTLMVVVQLSVGTQLRDMIAGSAGSATETLRVVARGMNTVQLGIDVAFDVFYCAGLVALGVLLYANPAFGRLVGAAGVACGVALFVLNVASFPYPPADSGLVDLGPVTGVWWLVVIACQIRRRRQATGTLAPA